MNKIKILYHVLSDIDFTLSNVNTYSDTSIYGIASELCKSREYNNKQEDLFYIQNFYKLITQIL